MTEKNTKQDDLGALAMQAAQLESEAAAGHEGQGGAPGADAVPPEQTNAEIIAGTLMMARDGAAVMFELRSLGMVAPDQRLQQIGVLWGNVADDYGWDLKAVMGKHANLFMAGFASFGLAREIAAAVSAELDAKARREAERTVDAAPPAAPQPA